MDRQKLLMIFGIAWLSAAALTWFLYAQTKAPKQDRMAAVLAAARDMPAGTRLRKQDVKTINVRERDLPKGAIRQVKDALERALLYPVNVNEPITSLKLASLAGPEGVPATIEPGKRAISVPITDSSGVAGLIQPKSRVDVLFTRTGPLAEAATTVIVQDVEVLSIGRITQIGQQVDPRAPRVPVATLVVTPEEARKLELAKNQGKIGLMLRHPLDRSVTDNAPVTADALDPLIHSRSARAAGKVPNIKDDEAWRELTGEKEKKEPPKPRVTVDVFRGDKHVQEIFQ